MKQIICMKWGNKYPALYVDKLYGMVARHLTAPFRFVCLTDQPQGIRPEVECLDCPSVPIPPPRNNQGWRKVSLWNDSLPGMEGDWLYLDLDVVVTGSLDAFFEYKPELSYIVMQNWTQPGKGIGNTSVFRFRVGSHPYLLHGLIANQDAIFQQFRNSQTYISRTVKDIAFWPDEWCILFKTHCIAPMPQRWWQAPSLPATARVVAFPGVPNPDEAVIGHWPAVWYKRIYKHILPATWIAEHWKE